MNKNTHYYWLLLLFSLICIYILAPNLDRRQGLMVSSCFALVLILNSRIVLRMNFILRCFIFIGIDLLTYFILFDDRFWNYLFGGGLFESSPWPLIVCSLIMSTAGGLLLNSWPERFKYFFITSGLQIPIAIFVGTPGMVFFFNRMSDILGFHHDYFGAWQAWQFEWMLTYYLPIYFFNLNKNLHCDCKSRV